jgi:cobalt-zinc-cadmium efflux system protein
MAGFLTNTIMAHSHDHSHFAAETIPQDGQKRRAFIIGIALNLLYVLAELIYGFLYNSMALLTDAGHNASDVASLLLSLIGFWMAGKKSSASFTYGYKKTTVLAALANAVILLIAVGILGFESIRRFWHPQPVQGPVVAWVSGLGLLINAITAFLFFRNRQQDLNIKSAYLHMLADALVSLGVLVAGILIYFTGWNWLDPLTGLIIMLVILVGTWGLLRDSFKMSIDAVPNGIVLDEIKNVMLGIPHVQEVHHVHIWPMSTTENALTANVVLSDQLSFQEKLALVDEIKHELLHHNIQHSTIEMK